MAVPCWKWHRVADLSVLVATCQHGNGLTPDGDPCDELMVMDDGEVMHYWRPPGPIVRLPYRVRLWNQDCGCSVDVLIDEERRVYWLTELCVREV